MKFKSNTLRKWSRAVHRDLSFFFSGMLLIYAVSGLVMNHRDSINPHYIIERKEYTLPARQLTGAEKITREQVLQLLQPLGEEDNYTKHYYPKPGVVKVFLKGGSNLVVHLRTAIAEYESVRKRHVISEMTKLHYNPGRWWTYFADAFAVGLILITLTGIIMLKGSKGLWGRGGVELLVGILIPLAFLFLF